MKTRKKGLFHFSSFILATTYLIIVSCSNQNDSEEHIKLVKTAKVEKIKSEQSKQFPGVVEEAEEVNLAFRVAGPIKRIHVKEGQFVKKGQLVAEMDTRDYMVQKNAIEAQVSQLQSEYKRVEELKNRKSVAANDFEKMKAGKEMAEAKLKNATDQLNDTKLYAPFSGYITKVNFENGELVNHGTPIASMVDISLLKVEINVPASLYINREKIKEIHCTQENLPDMTFPLVLFSSNIKANNNGLYKFYLYHTPEPNTPLALGMNVLVKVTLSGDGKDLLCIPASSIFEKQGKSFVWIVENNKVKSKEINTNNIFKNGSIGITNGLAEGENLVTAGVNLLSEGETVKVVQNTSKTNIGSIL